MIPSIRYQMRHTAVWLVVALRPGHAALPDGPEQSAAQIEWQYGLFIQASTL